MSFLCSQSQTQKDKEGRPSDPGRVKAVWVTRAGEKPLFPSSSSLAALAPHPHSNQCARTALKCQAGKRLRSVAYQGEVMETALLS